MRGRGGYDDRRSYGRDESDDRSGDRDYSREYGRSGGRESYDRSYGGRGMGRGYGQGSGGRGSMSSSDYGRDYEMPRGNRGRSQGSQQGRGYDTYYTYTEYVLLPGPMSGMGPEGYTRSSDRITENVNERLTDDGRVDASKVSVSVEDGEVTLSGTVGSRDQKRRAEELAESVRGVDDVHNRLTVDQDDDSSSGSELSSASGESSPSGSSSSSSGSSSKRSSGSKASKATSGTSDSES